MIKTVADMVNGRLEEIQETEIYYIYENHSVEVAAKYLVEHRMRAVGVFDHQERLCGVLSHSDIVDQVVAPDKIPRVTKVAEIMTKNMLLVTASASIIECRRLMRTFNLYHLIAVRDSVKEMFIEGKKDSNCSFYGLDETIPKHAINKSIITRDHFLGLISEKDLRKAELEKALEEIARLNEERQHLLNFISS